MLQISASGAKSWVQRITIQNKRRDIGLGSCKLISLAEAREKAVKNLKTSRDGGDPLAEREAQKVLTFEQATDAVLALVSPNYKSQKTAKQIRSRLSTYCFSAFGNHLVSEITAADVLQVLSPIWNEKPEVAKSVRQNISRIMRWSVAQGWRSDDPVAALELVLPKKSGPTTHFKSLPYSEVRHAIDVIFASHAGESVKLAFEFLILTACRSGEVRGAVWDEIDMNSAVWKIPPERMKRSREHKVPLSDQAIAVLRKAWSLSRGVGVVFPGNQIGKPMSDMTLSKLLRGNGIKAVPHGFRTSFRTWCQERTDISREIAEMCLAHQVGSDVEVAYARSDYFEKRRILMQQWANFVTD